MGPQAVAITVVLAILPVQIIFVVLVIIAVGRGYEAVR